MFSWRLRASCAVGARAAWANAVIRRFRVRGIPVLEDPCRYMPECRMQPQLLRDVEDASRILARHVPAEAALVPGPQMRFRGTDPPGRGPSAPDSDNATPCPAPPERRPLERLGVAGLREQGVRGPTGHTGSSASGRQRFLKRLQEPPGLGQRCVLALLLGPGVEGPPIPNRDMGHDGPVVRKGSDLVFTARALLDYQLRIRHGPYPNAYWMKMNRKTPVT